MGDWQLQQRHPTACPHLRSMSCAGYSLTPNQNGGAAKVLPSGRRAETVAAATQQPCIHLHRTSLTLLMNTLLSETRKKNELQGREMGGKKKENIPLPVFLFGSLAKQHIGSQHHAVPACCIPSTCSHPGRVRSPGGPEEALRACCCSGRQVATGDPFLLGGPGCTQRFPSVVDHPSFLLSS